MGRQLLSLLKPPALLIFLPWWKFSSESTSHQKDSAESKSGTSTSSNSFHYLNVILWIDWSWLYYAIRLKSPEGKTDWVRAEHYWSNAHFSHHMITENSKTNLFPFFFPLKWPRLMIFHLTIRIKKGFYMLINAAVKTKICSYLYWVNLKSPFGCLTTFVVVKFESRPFFSSLYVKYMENPASIIYARSLCRSDGKEEVVDNSFLKAHNPLLVNKISCSYMFANLPCSQMHT